MNFPGGSVLKNPLAVRETYVRFLGQEEPLEKEIETHSSILAWESPWKKKPGKLKFSRSKELNMT